MPSFNKLSITTIQNTKTRNISTEKPMTPLELLVERILSVIAILGLTCLCIGLLLHITGRFSNSSIVAQIGAYILVIGIVLIATRLIYWIMEKIVGRGLESTTK